MAWSRSRPMLEHHGCVSRVRWTLAQRGLRRPLPDDLSTGAGLCPLDGIARGCGRRRRRGLCDRLAPATRHPARCRAGLADRRNPPRPGQHASQRPPRRRAARAAGPPAQGGRARSGRPHRRRRPARRAAGALTAGPRSGRADRVVRPVQRRRRPCARHHPGSVPDALGTSAPTAARRPHPHCKQGATSMGNHCDRGPPAGGPAGRRTRRGGRVRRRAAGAGPDVSPSSGAAPTRAVSRSRGNRRRDDRRGRGTDVRGRPR